MEDHRKLLEYFKKEYDRNEGSVHAEISKEAQPLLNGYAAIFNKAKETENFDATVKKNYDDWQKLLAKAGEK